MCELCKLVMKGKLTIPELRQKLPTRIDLERNNRKKLHYQQLYGNLEAAHKRVMNSKEDTAKVWIKKE